MKTRITFLIALFISLGSVAQNGINYKAIVKDAMGNVIANDLIVVQFEIREGSAAGAVVYKENHTPITDANGLIIVDIGEGTPIIGTYEGIGWGSTAHFLNVQINAGTGLEDLGTSEFKTVPYALEAANVKGFVPLDQGNGIGWRITDRGIPEEYGAIGLNAVDLSYCTDGAIPRGAMGDFSTAMGNHTIATGQYSTTMGNITAASGTSAVAMGFGSNASGNNSVAMGEASFTRALASVALGSWNVDLPGDASNWVLTDPIFTIGIGESVSTRANAMTVLKNGKTGVGTTTPATTLHVNHPSGITNGFSISNGFDSDRWHFYTFSSNDLNLYLNNAAKGSFDDVSGAYSSLSDRNAKTNIEPMVSVLDKVKRLEVVDYNFKDQKDQRKYVGMIAQDIEPLFPHLVNKKEGTDENGGQTTYTLDYSGFGVLAIKALQEQQEQIESQQAIIEQLMARIEAIEKKN